MITVENLSKQFPSQRIAVNSATLTFQDGEVTYLLGPNGAGKSTLIRMIAGYSRPTAGTVSLDGARPGDHPFPLTQLGMMPSPQAFHPRRSARRHLQWLAHAGGISTRAVEDILDLVGLASVANDAVAEYSLGMRQRLAIACALLGNPQNIVLDEPLNGLDVEGIRWARGLFAQCVQEGRCLVVSSHLLPEVVRTGDHLIIMGAGEILADTTVREFLADAEGDTPADQLENKYVALTQESAEYASHRYQLLQTRGDGRRVH